MDEATSLPTASIGVRELKDRLSASLARVKDGEELTVTERGRPIARLVPIDAATDRMAELVAAGIVRPPTEPRRRPPATTVRLDGDGPDLADIVVEQRG